jgi:hypothetical protein
MPIEAEPEGGTRLIGGVTWESLADGRVHRLKRNKHFAGPVRSIQQQADGAARRLDRGVLAVREEFSRDYQYLWIQFTDQQLALGEPCRCGGRSQTRLHEKYGRCDVCGATIAYRGTYVPEPADSVGVGGSAPRRRTAKHLSEYTDLEFVARDLAECTEDEDVWYARALDPTGRRVFLVVRFPLEHGHRIPDPVVPGWDAHVAFRFRIDPFIRAGELGVLDAWDDIPPFGERGPAGEPEPDGDRPAG